VDDQRYPVLKFDGQNQTETKVGWSKMDFFLDKIDRSGTQVNKSSNNGTEEPSEISMAYMYLGSFIIVCR
jgi:hypothetical protein